jgi:hypothetical protein
MKKTSKLSLSKETVRTLKVRTSLRTGFFHTGNGGSCLKACTAGAECNDPDTSVMGCVGTAPSEIH